MKTFAKKMARTLFALALAASGIVLTGSMAAAAPVTIELCAVSGTANLTGAVTVPIWGFGIPTNPGDCSTATAGLPGPVLRVNEGDTVTINVINALPAGHKISFEIPGIGFNPGPTDAAVGATVTRVFMASAPGTYLYQSAGDAGRQVAMGLYGALIVRSATAGRAYDTATSAYDVEATLVLSQVDVSFNNSSDPNAFNLRVYKATYWLINGRAYPNVPNITAVAGQKLLLRYLNAGYDNTSMMLLGMHEKVIARDARLLSNPFLANAETIPAGGTEDALATIPSSTPPSNNGFPLYNRQLHLVSASCAAYVACTASGMLTFIHP